MRHFVTFVIEKVPVFGLFADELFKSHWWHSAVAYSLRYLPSQPPENEDKTTTTTDTIASTTTTTTTTTTITNVTAALTTQDSIAKTNRI